MDSVAFFDIVAAAAYLAALFLAASIPEDVLDVRSRRLLLCTLAMYFFIGASNVLQHVKITDFFDAYEDLFEMLSAPFFLMFLASVTTGREIKRRERSEQSLRESEEQYRTLVNNIPAVVWVSDRNGATTFISPKVQEIYGYAPEEILSHGAELWFDRVHPEDFEKVKASYEGLFTGQGAFEMEYRIRHREGHWIWLHDRAIKSYGSAGREFAFGTFSDITRLKVVEEALRDAHANLEHQYEELKNIDRIKDGLIRDVSHELKTPVAKHAMQLEILRPIVGKEEFSKAAGEALLVMEQSIRRQEGVIRNLLDLSQLEGGGRKYKKELLSLPELMEGVKKDYESFVERFGIEIAIDLPPREVRSDEEMLWHLFSNLIGNAIKFRGAEVPARINVTGSIDGKVLTVQVTDNGVGMSVEDLSRVFDRFYQVRTASEGSGVGLTICQMIASGLGGHIAITSEGKDRGTTVSVTLPIDESGP